MKPTTYTFHAASVSTLGLLAALAGCAGAPTRLATTEANGTPALVVRADGDYKAPMALRTVEPQYPVELRRNGTTGVVHVIAVIDESGKVQDARAESDSSTAMAGAAVAAFRKWMFKPASRDGVPVAATVMMPFVFKLDND